MKVVAEETLRPQRARKNTRRWCKGKVGREHRTGVRISGWVRWRVDKGLPACQPSDLLTFFGCGHEEYCEVCGKVLRHTLGDDCPDKAESRISAR